MTAVWIGCLLASLTISAVGVGWVYKLWPVDGLPSTDDDRATLMRRASTRAVVATVVLVLPMGQLPADAPNWASGIVMGLPIAAAFVAVTTGAAGWWLSGTPSRVPEWLVIGGWLAAAIAAWFVVGAGAVLHLADAQLQAGDVAGATDLKENVGGGIVRGGLWAGLLMTGLGVAHVVARGRRARRLRRAAVWARREAFRAVPMRGRASSTTVLSWNGEEH